jgi:hypothetical protein
VKEFNGKNHLPTATTVLGRKNKIYYYETWGDANLDGSCQGLSAGQPCDLNHLPTISRAGDSPLPDESVGYEPPDPDVSPWVQVFPFNGPQMLYRNVFQYRTVVPEIVGFTTNLKPFYRLFNVQDVPHVNDFNVTDESARYPSFVEIGNFKHNHTTIGTKDVADLVLSRIKTSQTFIK